MEASRVRAQLDRILASAIFVDADRARSFLGFIVERALRGRTGEIKESVIAVEVLGRHPSFDSKSDPIVRVEAGRLRDRLRDYYEGEGEADDVLISIPKGGYVPEFSERQPVKAIRKIDVLRLSILPPKNAIFDSFAISPDGRKLAFTAVVNGRLMLWIRALDSLETKPLHGTDFALFPFWSPDSRSIGFFTPSKLKTIPVAGGPSHDVADAVLGRGGAWNHDGVIVFSPRPVGILHQVSAAGGTPKPVTSLDVSRAEVAHGFPHFLPDGCHFLYLAASCHPGESSIRVGSLDSTASKVLFGADTSAIYAPALGGHSASLLFVSHGSLMAQPFDSQSLELKREPDIVVPEVKYRRWNQAGISVSNDGILLYQAGNNQSHQFGWLDRQGALVSVVGPRNDFASDPYSSFNLSPDERRVAIHRHNDPDTARPTIWVIDLSRDGALSRFSDAGSAVPEFCPVWSPDGFELLFSRGDDRGMRLLRQAISGGTAKCVLDTEGPKFPTDWSSDGRFVAYNSQVPDYQYQHTWIVSPAVGNSLEAPRPFLQHSHSEGSARFSPTDAGEAPRWMAYTSDETGRHEIYIRDFPGGTHKWQISNQGGLLPQWRRDGRELFYLAPDGALMAVAVNPGSVLEFGTPQRLFVTGLQLRLYDIWMNQYAVTHDGQRFLLNRPALETSQAAITAVIPR